MTQPALNVHDLSITFRVGGQGKPRGEVRAVDRVSLAIAQGETLGLVGESGSGKSTLARAIMGLNKPRNGSILFEGKDLAALSSRERRKYSRRIQMIFQDPYRSLNPRLTVEQLIAEVWEVHPDLLPAKQRRGRTMELLESVGLGDQHLKRFPHELSGGQCQRIAIARALAMDPSVIVCDEAVSALDVSVQAQILNLLARLQREKGLTYLFISHDLSVVQHVSDRIAVMYLGRIVETGAADEILEAPRHAYTQALLSAVPHPKPWEMPERDRIILTGEIPSPLSPPTGCGFRTRCWAAESICADKRPELEGEGGHTVACHLPEKVLFKRIRATSEAP
ncbi:MULTISPECIES: ABC transporter ATP-binding protein [unclassified Microbacterium]|uniref:ABC transporter ATP-binding protein n=1 Tax=unclassified Microbacterium TaxID=2609290 RepID=UPI00214ACD44|nr:MULTISPECIES: ABC transporter ATP-binding protein [unclassified Microbacterium]MCR2785963.1 ABC transporter ATP-binding protein [Microbacterium sp. zg.B96]WIM17065.1 ABC transporter ATP-binding protein [Microbacterium sp. zg-B96]